jgi:hypothetical protein
MAATASSRGRASSSSITRPRCRASARPRVRAGGRRRSRCGTHARGARRSCGASHTVRALDASCVRGARQMHRPPRPVRLTHWIPRRYEPAEILVALPGPPSGARPKPHTAIASDDPLLRIPPARYVEALLGQKIPSSRKIRCPFHDDMTPSFHIYPAPGQGWACFGCSAPDGRPRGGNIYTLASQLWCIPTQRRDFHILRARLDALFAIKRG